jgi:dynein light chain 4, axonemal
MAKAAEAPQLYKQSMEEFFKVAKYPLVRHCDMTTEMREEAVDVCITAVEKFPGEREKCTQVRTF